MLTPRLWLRPPLVLAAVLALASLTSTSESASVAPDPAEGVRLPSDTLLFVHIRVEQSFSSGAWAFVQQQLKAEEVNKLLEIPRGVLGVDIRDVESITLAFTFVGPPRMLAPYLHVRTKKPFARKDVLATLPHATEQAQAGLYARADADDDPMDALRFFDDRSFARGSKSRLEVMDNEPPRNETRSRHAAALALLDKHHVVVSLASTPDVKKIVAQALERNPRNNVEDTLWHQMAQVFLGFESGYVTLDESPRIRLAAQMRFTDQRQATRALRLAHGSVFVLQGLVEAFLVPPMDARAAMPNVSKLTAGVAAALDHTRITQNGNEVALVLEIEVPEEVLKRALLEAVLRVRGAAETMMRGSNLRHIVVAMHMFHNDYSRMPSNYCDPQGKPLLSWRVALLPYMEQNALYQKFKIDEPWDSPNNKPLIAEMPKFYQVPGTSTPVGQTHIQVFVGAPQYQGQFAPIFRSGGRQRLTLNQIVNLDGASNTLCVVEATHPVIWTKPDDIVIDADIDDLAKPGPALGALADDPHFVAAFADGSVRVFRRSLPDAAKYKRILRALVGVADGEAVDSSQLEAPSGRSSRTTFDSVGDRIEVEPAVPPKANPPPPAPPRP
ncbi:MAG TPA: DUF1559 domain-containing protein [Gemmatales bacterium]|nr:DUF1559 domain-containing protein [Gemmatales bacterium]